MSITPEQFQGVAARLIGGSFKNLRKAAVFVQRSSVNYQSQSGTTKTQTVQMIRKDYKETDIDGENIKRGDFMLVGEYQDFSWLPSVDNTTVTHNGISGTIKGVTHDAAEAVVKCKVRLR